MNESQSKRHLQWALKEPPSGYFVVLPQQQDEQEALDLRTVLAVTRRSWKVLVGMAVLGGAIGLGISYLMRDLYRAQAMVAPVEQNAGGAAGALKSQFGGLAALAGIDLGAAGSRRDEWYATLASPGFARDFILQHDLLPILYAKRWDAATHTWRAGTKPPKMDDAVKMFSTDVVALNQDKKNGIVTVTVEWYSPDLAAQWANGMIDMVNERLRTQATRTAEQSIEFLNKELEKANALDLRAAIYRLIESQVNNQMVANVQREYAFRFIDHAVAPQIRFSPKRVVMAIVGAVLGLFLAFCAVLFRNRNTGASRIPTPS